MRICDDTRLLTTLVFITTLIRSTGCFSFGFYDNTYPSTLCDYAKTPWYCSVQDVFHALFGQEEDWTAPCYRCSVDDEQGTDETFTYVPLFNTSYYNTTALNLVATLWTNFPVEQQTVSFYNKSLVFVQDVYTATRESSILIRNATVINSIIEYLAGYIILVRENLGSLVASCIDYISCTCTSLGGNVSRFVHPFIDYLTWICSSLGGNISCVVCGAIDYLTWNYSSRPCVCLWSGVAVMVVLTATLHFLRGARRHGGRSAREVHCSEYEIVSLDKEAQLDHDTGLAYDLCFTCFEPFTDSLPCRCSNNGGMGPQKSSLVPRSGGRRNKSGSFVKVKPNKSALDECASTRGLRFPFTGLNNNILQELPLHVHNHIGEEIPWDEYVCYSLDNFFEIPRWVTDILLCIRQDCIHDHSQVKIHGENVVVNKAFHEKHEQKQQQQYPHEKIIEDVGHTFTNAIKHLQSNDIAFLKGCGDIRNTGYLVKNGTHDDDTDTQAQTIGNDEASLTMNSDIKAQADLDEDSVQSLNDDAFPYYIDVPIAYQRSCSSNQQHGEAFLETIPETDETSSIAGCDKSNRSLISAGTMFRNIADVFFQSASVKGESPRGHGMWIDVSIDGDDEKDGVFTETHDHWHSVGDKDTEHEIQNGLYDDEDDDGFMYASVGLPLAESSFDNLSLPSYLLDSSLERENSYADISLDVQSEVAYTPERSTDDQSLLRLDFVQLSKNASIFSPDTSMYQIPALLLADCIVRRLSRVDQIRADNSAKPNITI